MLIKTRNLFRMLKKKTVVLLQWIFVL